MEGICEIKVSKTLINGIYSARIAIDAMGIMPLPKLLLATAGTGGTVSVAIPSKSKLPCRNGLLQGSWNRSI